MSDPILDYVLPQEDKRSLSLRGMREVCTLIARDLYSLGLGTKHYEAVVRSEVERCFSGFEEGEIISENIFLERTTNSTLFIFCFDLLQFVLKHTVDRVQHYMVCSCLWLFIACDSHK